MATQAERLLRQGLQVDPLGRVDYSQPGIGPTRGNQLANIAPDIARNLVRSAISAIPGVGGAAALGQLASTIKPSPDIANPAQASAMRGPNAPMARLEENLKKVAQSQQPVRTVTSPGFVRQTPAERARIAAASAPTMGGLESAGIQQAIRDAVNAQTLSSLEGETAAAQPRRNTTNTNTNQNTNTNTNTNENTDDIIIPDFDPPSPPPPGPAPVPVSDTIRSLYGEMSTRDFTDMIRNTMAEREANLRGLNQQSVDQLAANVLRRTGQIGDIKTALETELGVLDADRAGVQQGLVDAVAARAQELQAGTDASLAAAREALGPQVTDEFEKVAQIVGSQAASQATSSQDAMTRLAQIANMAAAERLAAPAELASEAELALGDDQFAYSQALQQNLSEALAGLDAEEAERVLGEAVRQENFNIGRDQRMIEALVGDLVRQDTQAFQAGQAQLGRDFQGEQAQLGRDFSADQSALSRAFSANQSALSRAFQSSERQASQAFKAAQADIARAAEQDAQAIKLAASQAAAQAEAADEQTAADLYKVDVALWRQMTGSERQALREDWIETQRLAGVGQEAFPMGTMQNLQQKYPKLSPEFFVHVNAMLGIDTLNVEEDDAAKKRDEYLKGLRTTDAFGAKGLTVDETSIIDQLYSELATDVSAVEESARLARNAQQLEMSSIGRRR